jgi:hypothetical protein
MCKNAITFIYLFNQRVVHLGSCTYRLNSWSTPSSTTDLASRCINSGIYIPDFSLFIYNYGFDLGLTSLIS